MLPNDDPLAELLLSLELRLIDPAVRKDRAAVSALLSKDFREFGSSGRLWTREATLDLLSSEEFAPPSVEDVTAQPISTECVLLTYRAVRGEVITLRSSLWIREQGQWRILFHQGTKALQS